MSVEVRIAHYVDGRVAYLPDILVGRIGVIPDFMPLHRRLLAVRCESPEGAAASGAPAHVATIESLDVIHQFNTLTDEEQKVALVWRALQVMDNSWPIHRDESVLYDIQNSDLPASQAQLRLRHRSD